VFALITQAMQYIRATADIHAKVQAGIVARTEDIAVSAGVTLGQLAASLTRAIEDLTAPYLYGR